MTDEERREYRRLKQNEYVRRSAAKRRAEGRKRYENTCCVCGKVWPSNKRKQYCYEHKDTRRVERARQRRIQRTPDEICPPRLWISNTCQICGLVFLTRSLAHRTCSDACRREWQHARLHIRYQYRRALTQGQVAGTFSASEWGRRLIEYDSCCAYCGSEEAIQIEHVIPLGCGGSQLIANVVPACACCNQDKGMLTPAQWLVRSDRAQAIPAERRALWPEGAWADVPQTLAG